MKTVGFIRTPLVAQLNGAKLRRRPPRPARRSQAQRDADGVSFRDLLDATPTHPRADPGTDTAALILAVPFQSAKAACPSQAARRSRLTVCLNECPAPHSGHTISIGDLGSRRNVLT